MLLGCVFEVVVHLLNEGVVASCYLWRWYGNFFWWVGEGRQSHVVWFSMKKAGKQQTGKVIVFLPDKITPPEPPANVSLSDNDEKLLILPLMAQYATWVYRLPVNSPDVTQVHHWLFMGVWVNLHFWKSAPVIVTTCTNNSPTGVTTLTDTLWGATSNS